MAFTSQNPANNSVQIQCDHSSLLSLNGSAIRRSATRMPRIALQLAVGTLLVTGAIAAHAGSLSRYCLGDVCLGDPLGKLQTKPGIEISIENSSTFKTGQPLPHPYCPQPYSGLLNARATYVQPGLGKVIATLRPDAKAVGELTANYYRVTQVEIWFDPMLNGKENTDQSAQIHARYPELRDQTASPPGWIGPVDEGFVRFSYLSHRYSLGYDPAKVSLNMAVERYLAQPGCATRTMPKL